jgi:hypothetical protein
VTSTPRTNAQAALFARFGVPRALPPDVVDEDGTGVVRVYAVGSEAAARAFVDAERGVLWGNPARAELRDGVGWVVVVDLRPAIAARKAERVYRNSLGGWQRGGRP